MLNSSKEYFWTSLVITSRVFAKIHRLDLDFHSLLLLHENSTSDSFSIAIILFVIWSIYFGHFSHHSPPSPSTSQYFLQTFKVTLYWIIFGAFIQHIFKNVKASSEVWLLSMWNSILIKLWHYEGENENSDISDTKIVLLGFYIFVPASIVINVYKDIVNHFRVSGTQWKSRSCRGFCRDGIDLPPQKSASKIRHQDLRAHFLLFFCARVQYPTSLMKNTLSCSVFSLQWICNSCMNFWNSYLIIVSFS